MGLALHHALVLLLVLLPLVITTAYTTPLRDGIFRFDCHSDNLTDHILEWAPESDDEGMEWKRSYVRVPANFIGLDMSVCHAGACNASEIRRGLAYRRRYISYEALKKYRVPCNRRGKSYYNCRRGRQANPYRRGCSFITRCARIFN